MKRRVKLIQGLPRKKLLQEIFYHLRNGEASRRALAFYLLDLNQRREYQALGYSSAAHFGESHLGLSQRETRELLRIARELEELPGIDQAFAQGDVGWSKVREITRVATSATEGEWLAFAKEKLYREIEWAVAQAKKGERPKPDGLGTPRATFNLRFRVSADVNEVVQVALAKLMDEGGAGSTPAEALKAMAELAIKTDREGNVPGRRLRKQPVYTVVYHASQDGQQAWVNGEDGPVAIEPRVVEKAAEKGRKIKVRDVEDPGNTRSIRFGERGTVAPRERDKKTTETQRTATLARDGFQCLLCRSRRHLRVHHLDAHGHGGKSEIQYLVTLCGRCHTNAHEGFLELRVDEKKGIVALGPAGRPLKHLGGVARALKDAPELMTGIQKVAPTKVINPEANEAPPSARDPHGACRAPSSPPLSSVNSIDQLPETLSASEWREFQGRLEWSRQRGAFIFYPERQAFPTAMGDPRGSRSKKRAGEDKELQKRDERFWSSSSRPQRLTEFVGQARAVENFALAVEAARQRGEPLGHVLLSGPGGLGKTTLAGLLASEMDSKIHLAMGPFLEQPQQLVSLLCGVGKNDIVFIDEIHRLSNCSEECLYSALEDGVVDVLVGERGCLRTIRVELEPFTLVGATTQLGALSEPFRARFGLQERLEFYTETELREVIKRAAVRHGVAVTSEAREAIAQRARGTPREALRLLARTRDLAQAARSHGIEGKHVEESSARLGIDARGLWPDERRILRLLISHRRPMGLEAISVNLGMDPNTIRLVHEPFLVKRGYVVRLQRGREATLKAHRDYGMGMAESA